VTRLLHARRGFSGGFTLVEVMTVVGIVGITMALGISYLGNFKRRGNFATATGDLQVALRMAKAEAYSRGTSVVFIVDTAGGNYYVVEDVANAINVATTAFNPNALPAGDNLITKATFPSTVSFASAGPTAYTGTNTLPLPYNAVPTSASAGCTFCTTSGPNPGFGSITFTIGRGAVFSSSTANGSLTVASSGPTTVANRMVFAVVGRTGTFETFEVLQ
jgi:prepilin-type N-terminal cleavage/methylation domain-containing protein